MAVDGDVAPERPRMQPMRRKHIMVCLTVGMWAAGYTAFYVAVGAPMPLVVAMAVCTMGGLGVSLAVGQGMPLRDAAKLLIILMFCGCAPVPFIYGGIGFAGNAWLLAVPIASTSMRSPKLAVYTTVCLVVVCAASFALGEFNMLPDPLVSDRYLNWLAVINLPAVALLLLVIGRMHSQTLRARTDKVQEINRELVKEVEHRKRVQADLEKTRSELMEAARFAGRAEVATGALHNIGNALTSVSVSTARAGSLLRQQRIGRVDDLARLLERYDDPRLSAFALVLAKDLRRTQAAVQAEMESAVAGVDHVANVVAVQQEHARHGGLAESVDLAEEVNKAMVLVGLPGPHVVTVCGTGTAVVDRHRLLQILGNLMKNAKDAVSGKTGVGRIAVSISADDEAQVVVTDNGVGIDGGNLERVFAHGYSTKSHGSGFGLHASALAAHEIGGSLNVESAGSGNGATFVLRFPLYPADVDSVCDEAGSGQAA